MHFGCWCSYKDMVAAPVQQTKSATLGIYLIAQSHGEDLRGPADPLHDRIVYIGQSRYVDRTMDATKTVRGSLLERAVAIESGQLWFASWESPWRSYGRRVDPIEWSTIEVCQKALILQFATLYNKLPDLNR